MRTCAALLALLFGAACVGPEDRPSHVRDLRLLGVRLEPPELMAPGCSQDDPRTLATFASPLTFTALIEDPAGEGRPVRYELFACARPQDRTCQQERVLLAEGQTGPGELQLTVAPGAQLASDGRPLLAHVVEQDTYRGLGGIRLPLNLHLRAGDEELWGQKLMVYSCPLLPGMAPNVNPEVPPLRLQGELWEEGAVPTLSGQGPFTLELEAPGARQEAYVVASYELEPVALTESWEAAWFTTVGRMGPEETGGADFGGGEGRHRTEWTPGSAATQAQDVTFWIVVRDGRGGTGWARRTARWTP